MKAWSVARRCGRQALAGALAERAAPGGTNVALPQAKERFEAQVCIYCCGKAGLKVGYLSITKSICYCKEHGEQYQSDKAWEAKYKLEMGL